METKIKQNQIIADKLVTILINISESEKVSASKFNTLCDNLLDTACEVIGTDCGSLMVYDDFSFQPRLVASRGIPFEKLKTSSPHPDFLPIAENCDTITKLLAKESFECKAGKMNSVSVPIRSQNAEVGVLRLHYLNYKAISTRETQKTLDSLAKALALLMENAKLNQTIVSSRLEILESLMRMLKAKDEYTFTHSQRTRIKMQKIAKGLDLPEEKIKIIELGALLHDIGKTGISESILLKPCSLSRAEYETIKHHPKLGSSLIEPIKFLQPLVPSILLHQEWYDGSGYPFGLKGEDIPVEARIISIIDAWDAMTSKRPYRAPLHRKTAIDELRKGMGTQFDGDIVDLFLDIERKDSDF
jgi:HD-GYP domain-containing protein (c-di-GMP phosphodiesterase class II)